MVVVTTKKQKIMTTNTLLIHLNCYYLYQAMKKSTYIFIRISSSFKGFPDGSAGKEFACNAGDRRHGFSPWVGKIPWRRKWQPTPVYLPGESLWTEKPGELRPQGCKESDMTEQLSNYALQGISHDFSDKGFLPHTQIFPKEIIYCKV